MAPCERAACRYCGKRVGLFMLEGFGCARRRHERNCSARGALHQVPAPTATLLARQQPAITLHRVDLKASPMYTSLISQMRMLSVTRDELEEFLQKDPAMAKEMMHNIIVTWRPGAEGASELRCAIGRGPGNMPCLLLFTSFCAALA